MKGINCTLFTKQKYNLLTKIDDENFYTVFMPLNFNVIVYLFINKYLDNSHRELKFLFLLQMTLFELRLKLALQNK